MQAGSRTEHGSYKVIRGFDIGIPDLPRGLAALIRDEQRRTTAAKLVRIGPKVNLASLPRSGEAGLTQREWCRLLRNRYFANAWHKGKKLGDQSNSAYEYHLAKGALCQGLSEEQADHIIGAWRTHHNAWGSGGGRRRAAIRTTIVKAWREVSAWVAAWQERKRLDAEARAGKATRNQILAVIAQHGPQTPKSAAEHLGMRRERTKKALQRMAAAGELKKVTRGRYGTTSGTSSSTTEAQAAALPRIARKESPTTIAARALLGSNPLITAAELRAHLGITSKYAAVLIRRIGRRMAATLEQQVMADTLSSTLAQHANVNLPTSIRQCQHTEVNAPMALTGASMPEANDHPFCGDTHKCPLEVFPFLSAP
jgi:DNA-binding MarR family transcriptional regulator